MEIKKLKRAQAQKNYRLKNKQYLNALAKDYRDKIKSTPELLQKQKESQLKSKLKKENTIKQLELLVSCYETDIKNWKEKLDEALNIIVLLKQEVDELRRLK